MSFIFCYSLQQQQIAYVASINCWMFLFWSAQIFYCSRKKSIETFRNFFAVQQSLFILYQSNAVLVYFFICKKDVKVGQYGFLNSQLHHKTEAIVNVNCEPAAQRIIKLLHTDFPMGNVNTCVILIKYKNVNNLIVSFPLS